MIRQQDHAALAADLMARWRGGGLPDHPRRAAILAATREHDNGWQEEDDALHLGAGGEPLDFITVPAEVKRRIWPRAVSRLASRSAYVAALVAEHARTIYAPLRGEAGWDLFLAAMEGLREAQLERLPPPDRGTLPEDYPFVRTGDLLSLVFCNGWREPQSGPGCRVILEGITLAVSPDPFGGEAVEFQVDARAIPARPYRSREDLQGAYADGAFVPLRGRAIGV